MTSLKDRWRKAVGVNEQSWLELAYDRRDADMVYLLVDPLLTGLREETRWALLIDRMGLPHRI